MDQITVRDELLELKRSLFEITEKIDAILTTINSGSTEDKRALDHLVNKDRANIKVASHMGRDGPVAIFTHERLEEITPARHEVDHAIGSAADIERRTGDVLVDATSGHPPLIPFSDAIKQPINDDLELIKGIDAKVHSLLVICDVRRFADIAAFNARDVNRFNFLLGLPGEIERRNWIEQAAILAAGGQTKYARELSSGCAPDLVTGSAPVVPRRDRLAILQNRTRGIEQDCTSKTGKSVVIATTIGDSKPDNILPFRQPKGSTAVDPAVPRSGGIYRKSSSIAAMLAIAVLGTCIVGVDFGSGEPQLLVHQRPCKLETWHARKDCSSVEISIAQAR